MICAYLSNQGNSAARDDASTHGSRLEDGIRNRPRCVTCIEATTRALAFVAKHVMPSRVCKTCRAL
jgi:hypothetical protein